LEKSLIKIPHKLIFFNKIKMLSHRLINSLSKLRITPITHGINSLTNFPNFLLGQKNYSTEETTTTNKKNENIDEIPKTKSAEFKTYFNPAPPVKVSTPHLDRDKRSHRVGVQEVSEGVAGERAFEFVDPRSVNYPTIETLKEIFGGVPYSELPEVRIYLSKNNTKVFVYDHLETYLFRTTCGTEGYRNCKKKSEVAGQTVGVSTGNKLKRRGLTYVRVILSGLGPGRQSSIQGLTMSGINVVSLTDNTPLPEFGPRPRKRRRL